MDNLTKRFSVYDFFNPIIAGMTFILAELICSYPFLTRQLLELFKGEKTAEIQVLTVVGILIIAYIIGAVLQVPAHWFIDRKIHYERDLIEHCLDNGKVLPSKVRRDFITEKAMLYFRISNRYKFNNNITDYCKAFFPHCVYYLHIKKLDGKTERMRETQALSKLLVCVFFIVPFISFIIAIIQYESDNINYNWLLTVFKWMICLVLSIGFYFRYRQATKNRIAMTLSLYEASFDKSEN